jgi:CRISPR-associated protein Cas1
MTDRVLDISQEPARLSIRNSLLVVETGGIERAAIPCGELAAVVIGHRQVSLTQSVLSELAKAGALLVTCDEKFQPASMVLPLDAHHAQAERFRAQAAMDAPKKKRLWQAVVRAKIRAQADVLRRTTGSDDGLVALVAKVRSGDPDNVEARAARRYWSRLFEEGRFRRRDDEDTRNHLLNYGYAVLRSITARAVCGAGLHPSFSLFHSNAANPFGLADDLMEPFRPLVDEIVHGERAPQLSPEMKHKLIGGLLCRYEVEREERTLPDILTRLAQSLAAIVVGAREKLWIPELRPATLEPGGTDRSIPDETKAQGKSP